MVHHFFPQLQVFRAVRLVFGLLAALSPVFWAQAQEETPEPPPDFIYFWSSEVIFPEAVRFTIVISRPGVEVSNVRLTIEPAGQSPVDIPISVAATAVNTVDFTELVYFWPIPRANPPRPFTKVTYRWRVVTSRDEVADFRDTFVFRDTRTEWNRDEDPNGLLNLTVPSDTINPKTLRAYLTPVYDLLARNTDEERTFNVILYHNALPLSPCIQSSAGSSVVVGPESKVEVPCDSTMAEAVYHAAGYTPIQVPNFGAGSEQAALVDLMVASFYDPIWRGKAVPEWFRNGLAQLYLPTIKSGLLSPVLVAARNARLFDLDGMTSAPPVGSEQESLWRAQSYSMVLYITEQIGVEGVFQLANKVGNTGTFAEAYQQAVGQPLSALLPTWENWIFRSTTALAYGFTPYQPPTPSPTTTRTPTPFPPTRTNTPTDTPTFTPSPTVTGFLSPTPLPTLTPAPTRTPAPPTLTPRPAGSPIDTPTPVPTPLPPMPSQTVDTSTAVFIIGAIFGLLLILSYVYLRVTRNR